MNKRVIFFDPHKDGCSYYRIQTPYNWLSQKYSYVYKVDLLPTQHDSIYDTIDTFVFHRLGLPYFHEHFFPWLKSKNKRIVIDMDDNLWEIPEYNRANHFWNSTRLDDLTKNLKCADMVVCSTVTLEKYIGENINPNVVVIPNMLTGVHQYRKSTSTIPHVVWAGSPSHEGDFNTELVELIIRLVNENKIKFSIFGEVPNIFKNQPKINHVKWCPVDKYHETLHNLNADIGLIVCKENLFNDCKSPIKYLEYSNCSMVSIADNVHPYYSTISHMDNGLIVNNISDWEVWLNLLIENIELRNKLSYNAHSFVSEHFNVGNRYEAYLSHWESIL